MRTPRPAPQHISVVIPVRNAAATIGAQLQALAAQDYEQRWELIIVDDGSRDDTAAIAAAHAVGHDPRTTVLTPTTTTTKNRASAARNRGARAARGDLVAFCDADDVVAPGWLSALAAASRHGDIVAGVLETSSLNAPATLAWQRAPAWQRRTPRPQPDLTSANCAVWIEAFRKLGGFDEGHPGAEDKDLAWRAAALGFHIHPAPDAVVAYRLRTSLRATAVQRYHWGRSEPRLYRDHAARIVERDRGGALRSWAWSLATVPALAWSPVRRGPWIVRTAQLAGRAVGSVRERVLFP